MTPPPAPSTTTSTPSPPHHPNPTKTNSSSSHPTSTPKPCSPTPPKTSISTIAADLADDVDDSRRCVALAISRMADGGQLLVERALDHLETKEMAAHSAKG